MGKWFRNRDTDELVEGYIWPDDVLNVSPLFVGGAVAYCPACSEPLDKHGLLRSGDVVCPGRVIVDGYRGRYVLEADAFYRKYAPCKLCAICGLPPEEHHGFSPGDRK